MATETAATTISSNSNNINTKTTETDKTSDSSNIGKIKTIIRTIIKINSKTKIKTAAAIKITGSKARLP